MPTEPAKLRELVEICLARMEEEGFAALESLCEEHPEEADALRSRIRTLRDAGLLESDKDAALPEQLGEFMLGDKLGSGGMGVVYAARQASLEREVALKLIRPEHLYFPGARERFEREVGAVARLNHPGIVPVYTVGEEKGIPYFTMEKVEGKSLGDLLEIFKGRKASDLRGPDLWRELDPAPGTDMPALFDGSWTQICLRIVKQVAEALDHAHQRGVLHRDVKPTNIMLTPEGRVLLLDFGLAHSEHTPKITRTGSMLGSLAYMSPEQILGNTQDWDERTDIYGLGVSLYEILTFTLPYGGQDAVKVRQRILEGSPASIQSLNPSVARDAGTITLKAMDQERIRRYSSAKELAEDIERFLELRPILARRKSRRHRVRRWAQRNKAASVALVLGFLLVVGGPLAFAIQSHNSAAQIQTALDQEREARHRAQAYSHAALDAVDTFLYRTGAHDLAHIPQFDKIRQTLLEEALALYDKFLEFDGDNEGIQRQAASARVRHGDILLIMGRESEARPQIERGLAELRGFAKDGAKDPHLEVEIAIALGSLGILERNEGEIPKAIRLFEEGVALLRPLHAAGSLGEMEEHNLARCWQNLLSARQISGKLEGLDPEYESLIRLQRKLAEGNPDAASLTMGWGIAVLNCGAYYRGAGKLQEARAQYEAAIPIFERAAQNEIQAPRARASLARCHMNIALTMLDPHSANEAARQMEKALAIRLGLLESFPERISYAVDVGMNYYFLGRHHSQQREFAKAEEVLDQGISLTQDWTRKLPQNEPLGRTLAKLQGLLGTILFNAKRYDEALPCMQATVAYFKELLVEHPQDIEVLNALGSSLYHLYHYHRVKGEKKEQETCIEDSLRHYKKMATLYPRHTDSKIRYSVTLGAHLKDLIDGDRRDEAARELLAAMDAGILDARAFYSNPEVGRLYFEVKRTR